MRLNTLKPADGSKKDRKRVGRGVGSGHGKTCGRGVKGQKSRSGGMPKIGFEGGQMPIQRRLPKRGFSSRVSIITDEVRLHEIAKCEDGVVDIDNLKKANIITNNIKRVKIIFSGEITTAVTVRGIKCTKGAREAIEAAGGKIEE